jgi:hypothetical protein
VRQGPERNSVVPIAMAEVSARPAGKAMTSPDVLEAFERSVAGEDALESLLEERRAWREQMLRTTRAAIGGR